MSSEDASDDSDLEDPDGRPDPDEVETINADGLMEKMRARRDEQREQVTHDWCETIRDTGERYREHGEVNAVADELEMDTDEIREALTVYRLRFEEPPGTAAMIASDAGRAFFAFDTDVDGVVDLKDQDYSVEELVREYVGAVYLKYDVDAEPIGDPVERDVPELAGNFDEIAETITDAVTIPSDAFAAATAMDNIAEQFTMPTKSPAAAAAIGDMNETIAEQLVAPTGELAATAAVADVNKAITEQLTVPTDAFAVAAEINDLNDTLAQQLTIPVAEITAAAEFTAVHEAQFSILAASVQPILKQHNPLMESVAATAAALTDVLTEIEFPKPVLADLAAIQPSVDAAAIAAAPAGAAGHVRVSHRSVSPPEPETAETGEPSISSEPGMVESAEPTVDLATGAPVGTTVDTTLPTPDTVSSELVFEVPALVVDCILSAGEVRAWFSELPQNHQKTVVNVMLISATLSVTGSPTWAALTPFIAPSVRQMINANIDELRE